jgi:prevent-host-death family protein
MSLVAEVAPISDLRHRQNEIIELLSEGPVILTQRGRGTAVLLSMDRWKQVMRQVAELSEMLEEAQDVRVTDEMMARVKAGEEPTYSHEEVWAEIEELEAKGALPD